MEMIVSQQTNRFHNSIQYGNQFYNLPKLIKPQTDKQSLKYNKFHVNRPVFKFFADIKRFHYRNCGGHQLNKIITVRFE